VIMEYLCEGHLCGETNDPGFVGRSGGSPARRSRRRFFPHFAPLALTCRFAAQKAAGALDLELTVEQCGVQWSAVE